MGILALAAIVGITSAFTTKGSARPGTSRKYGVVSVFTGSDSKKHYNVQLFTAARICDGAINTCSGFYTSLTTVSTVLTTALASKAVGNFL